MALFQPGQSGNPAGPKKGVSRNPLAAARKLIAPHVDQLVEQQLAEALQGNSAAGQACLAIFAVADQKHTA